MFNNITRARVVRGRDVSNNNLDPVISANAAYSIADAVGGLNQFSGVTGSKQGSGLITGITVIDKIQQHADLRLMLFTSKVTVAADNAAFTISDADMEFFVAGIAIPTASWVDVAAVNSFYHADFSNPIAFQTTDSNTLYGQLELPSTTPTWTATTQLIVKLHVLLLG